MSGVTEVFILQDIMYCYMKRWTTLSIKSRTKREIERIALEHDMNQCEAVDMLVEEYRSEETRESEDGETEIIL